MFILGSTIAIPNIEIINLPMNPYGWTAIAITALSIIMSAIYVIWMHCRFKKLGYYESNHETPIEFKPLDNISLEEYICLLPKTPKTAAQAMLVELDRQGKIEITGSKFKRKLVNLSEKEAEFLDVLENQGDAARKFLFSENGISLINSADQLKNNQSTYKQLLEKGLIRDSSNKIYILNPIAFIVTIFFIAIIVFYVFGKGKIPVTNEGTDSQVIWLIISLFLVTPLCIAFFYWQRKRYATLAKYTPEGIAVLDYYSGLKSYIKHVEKSRLEYFQDKHKSEFLKLTPYLILFGMEKTWTKRLNRYERTWANAKHNHF
ncbi:DUF2207 domain-containing protein [Candidatus Saccharibacteria bacterium]|nr:DUF2207 domain-containing protein [Candidatus Saccharibacteria bacterium]